MSMKTLRVVNILGIAGFGICFALATYKSFVVRYFLAENRLVLSDVTLAAFNACLAVWISLACCAFMGALLAAVNFQSGGSNARIKAKGTAERGQIT